MLIKVYVYAYEKKSSLQLVLHRHYVCGYGGFLYRDRYGPGGCPFISIVGGHGGRGHIHGVFLLSGEREG